MIQRPSVLVGMSGGVDSSVAAALLVKEGYRVVGGFIKNWSDSKDVMTGECQWRGERRDALRVAAKLGIPLLTFDFEEAYRKTVVDELFRGYAAGETPNPDVLCNEFIKFGLFADEAVRLGFGFIATGHYARVEKRGEEAHLLRGADPSKDQSYFLYRVPQNVLRRTLFPIGHLLKSEVRAAAKALDLPVAEKPDSQGICFIGKLDMAEFLRMKIPSKPGDIVDENGTVLGRHEGLDGFTIGQRQRIKVPLQANEGGEASEPLFVAEKDIQTNRLLVVQGADHPRLFRREARIHDLHWTRGEVPAIPFGCDVQVRYRQEPARVVLNAEPDLGSESLRMVFVAPVKAVAPGQSAALYQEDECIGGGIISN
jgi:tRNA-uridine 2-sulfurtransferase